MRDKQRPDKFYTELCSIHKDLFQDWRFGQFYSNFFGWLVGEKNRFVLY